MGCTRLENALIPDKQHAEHVVDMIAVVDYWTTETRLEDAMF
jgi:hypothetical protein